MPTLLIYDANNHNKRIYFFFKEQQKNCVCLS